MAPFMQWLSRMGTQLGILSWLPSYSSRFIALDAVAGLTLASFVLPESMAYATLAGLPPASGIYCILAGGLLFAFFTSSNQAVIGPTSAISLMVGSTLAVLSGGDPTRWAAIAALTALVIFVLCLAAYMLRLSALVSFISENILLGFKAGAALTIIATQLPKLFGFHAGGSNFFERIGNIAMHLPETNVHVLLFGLCAFALLVLGNRLLPGWPVSLAVVVLSLLVMSLTSLSGDGFQLAGAIQGGLPSIARPSLRFQDVDGVFGLALGCFLVGYIETIAVTRTFAEKHSYSVSPRQELLALGMANLGAAFAGGYPVSGGLSQSTVNDKAGGRSPFSLLVCSAALAGLLLFGTQLLENLPEVILAAVVLDAVLGLIKIRALKQLFHLSKTEFAVAMLAVAGVLFFGILKGVLIAAVGSIVILLAQTRVPNIAVLGRIPGTNRYSDIFRNPGNEEIPGIKIMRVESSILYYNEEHVLELMQSHVSGTKNVRSVILDLSAAPYVDVSGGRMLLKFSNNLKEKNISLKIVEALGIVRDMLRKLGLEEVTGHISRTDSIDKEVTAFIEKV